MRPLPEIQPSEDSSRICPELASHSQRVIWAEGHERAPLFVLLDNPGLREDRTGTAFVCPTRQTLREAAHQVGLSDADLYVTWLLKRRPTKKYDKPAAYAAGLVYVKRELEQVRPQLILALGNAVTETLFGQPVKALRGRMLTFAGYPVLCSYHPLAIRRRPNLKELFSQDLAAAAGEMQKKS